MNQGKGISIGVIVDWRMYVWISVFEGVFDDEISLPVRLYIACIPSTHSICYIK
jgi:hypothetical protein